MSTLPLVAKTAPEVDKLTPYDLQHTVTYLRLLDADNRSADWREVASIVLALDPDTDPVGAERTWASHLSRAKWMARTGYRLLFSVDRNLWDANRPNRLAP